MALWNNREIEDGSEAAAEGSSVWAPVGVLLGAVEGDSEPARRRAFIPSGSSCVVLGAVEGDSEPGTTAQPSVANTCGQLADRYRDAYRIANATVAIGAVLKLLAFCAGGLALILSMTRVTSAIANLGTASGLPLLIGIAAALILGVPLYALGILVSAHGQVLKATLDTAVNTSPFLENDQKAKIILD